MLTDTRLPVMLNEAGVSKARRLPARDVRDFVSTFRSEDGEEIAICVQGGDTVARIYLTPAEAEHFWKRLEQVIWPGRV
jgi:hypothetical protein